MPRKNSDHPNRTFMALPISHQDRAYLFNLISTDIARLKGSGERVLLSAAYRLHDKISRIRASATARSISRKERSRAA